MRLTRKPTAGRLVRGFGAPPATPTSPPSHLGEDWGWVSEPYGEPIYCPAPGRVRATGTTREGYGYGMWTEVDHGDGYTTLYAHQLERRVDIGDEVTPGDVLGLIGDSGNTTAPHLHFELRRNGVAIDPAPFYNLSGVSNVGDRPITTEEGVMYPVEITIGKTGHLFTFGPEFVRHEPVHGDNGPGKPATGAVLTRNVLTSNDQFVKLTEDQGKALAASFGIPWGQVLAAKDAKTGHGDGRVWSIGRDLLRALTNPG
jgi:hypothetical protein